MKAQAIACKKSQIHWNGTKAALSSVHTTRVSTACYVHGPWTWAVCTDL